MYAIQAERAAEQQAGPAGHRARYGVRRRSGLADTLVWRSRWFVAATIAVALLALGYAREAAVPAPAGGAAAAETVTVASGDTLWTIASRRYPDADPRQKVYEIEQLNGLGGPTIVPGQRLRVPAG
jgi:nucleoid-associated protein YgaU